MYLKLVQIPGRAPAILLEVSRVFPQMLQANAATVPQILPRTLPSTVIPIIIH
jgi:hypothetical protein